MKKLMCTLFSLSPVTALAAGFNFSIQAIVKDVFYLIIIGIVFGLLYFLADKAPFIPGWAKSGIKYVILFAAVVLIIAVLLSLVGISLF